MIMDSIRHLFHRCRGPKIRPRALTYINFSTVTFGVQPNNFPLLHVQASYISSLYHQTAKYQNNKYVNNRRIPARSAAFRVQKLWKDELSSSNNKVISNISPTENSEIKSRQSHVLDLKLKSAVGRASHMTNKDWDDIRSSILELSGSIREQNIDAIILLKCSDIQDFSMGKSYFKYLKSFKKSINRACYGNYLRHFYICSSDCSDEDFKEIDAIYNELNKVHKLLDVYTTEKVILALSLTNKWKEYKELLEYIKSSYSPSVSVYCAVIKAAFQNQETDLGWELMAEIAPHHHIPDELFMYWLNSLEYQNIDDGLSRLFWFLNQHNIKPSQNVCKQIKNKFEKVSNNRRGNFTSVLRRGECKSCGATLEIPNVTQQDYETLKSAFLNPVLIGKDIFQKTRPEEFNTFLAFLKKSAPYDIVLDGLNIALKVHKKLRSHSAYAFLLTSTVKHFVAENKRVLVLGKQHMRKWPKEDMQYIYNNALVFLTEDTSQDDPFLLYATLYSGLGTCFVSKDLMRGHKFLLANPKLQAIFQKWQAQHQYFIMYVQNNGAVKLQEPLLYMQSIQQNSQGDWHIPYYVKESFTTNSWMDHYHRHWLCLTNQPPKPLSNRFGNRKEPINYSRKIN